MIYFVFTAFIFEAVLGNSLFIYFSSYLKLYLNDNFAWLLRLTLAY